ncbi:flagellar biosynthesis protein FlhA [bacterium SCN 62-11]|nr:MAG: flagellar biosynthesis protein FlhA [bacterium SCN 62-11]
MLNSLLKNADLLLLGALVGILLLMMLPMPPIILDLLLTYNIAFSLAILLVTIYAKKALDFAVFPSVLLIVTLARLALNVASTRLILLHGNAGQVITTFGQFVVGGNYLVGLIIFSILVLIQFVVITNGAGRVAEVAARFTLDAMPGKQMSIDADLAAGNITQEEAQARRQEISRESEFYGTMDGAGKFVKGDAIAAVIIMLVNVFGGLIIGVTQKGMPLMAAVQKYTLLTIGEGLVAQISALLVSTATGLIVTRAASQSNLGTDLTRQFVLDPLILKRIAALLMIFSLIPGLPKLPFWGLAGFLWLLAKSPVTPPTPPKTAGSDEPAAGASNNTLLPEEMLPLLDLEPIELEIGYALVEFIDEAQGGDLLHRVVQIRKSCATELGVIVTPIRIRDNLQLRPGQYRLKIYGQIIGEGECMPRRFLAMSSGQEVGNELDGIPVKEPVFGLPAIWINAAQREQAEIYGYTVVDPTSVIATHLSELLRKHAPELLGRQEVQQLIDHLKERFPKLVDDVIPAKVSMTQLRLVLQNLLRERVSIRDLRTILENLADHSNGDGDPAWLTEKVREGLARNILQELLSEDQTLRTLALAPSVESALVQALPGGSGMDPRRLGIVATRIARAAATMAGEGLTPVLLCSQRVRPLVRRLAQRPLPSLVVLSYEEIPSDVTLETYSVVSEEGGQ